MTDNNTDVPLYCSFCGREKKEVSHIVAGPKVLICNLCVAKCSGAMLAGEKRCDNCKHWEFTKESSDCPVRPQLGNCAATPHVSEASEWTEDLDHKEEVDEYIKTTAFAYDGSDYVAGLLTKPEHYCSMWKEKRQ